MKDFTDALMNTVLQQEIPRINNIMNEVTKNVAEDLLKKTIILLDSYYDNYTPIRYVRLYKKKRKLKSRSKGIRKSKNYTSQKPKSGGISLHTAIERMENNDAALISMGDYDNGWTSGIIFDSQYFRSNMRHPGSGISGWNMVENFLFSETWTPGSGNYPGNPMGSDPKMLRSVQDDGMPGEAEFILEDYLENYDNKLDKFYKDACKKY